MIYSVLPVTKKNPDGKYERTLVANYLPSYYTDIEKDGLIPYAFYDGGIRNFEDFARFALSKDVVFLLMFNYKDKVVSGQPVGHMYITGIQGYCGMGHFSILRPYHKEAKQIMSDTLETVFSVKRTDGTPFLKTILGVVPITNRPAIRAIKRVGFEHIATIPDMCRLFYKRKYVAGYMARRDGNGWTE